MLIKWKCKRKGCARVGRYVPLASDNERTQWRFLFCRACAEDFAEQLPTIFDCVVRDVRTGQEYILTRDHAHH